MITKEDFENIAMLSRLAVDEDAYPRFSEDLDCMVAFVDKIAEATEEIADFEEDFVRTTAFREDEVFPSASREEILRNAPCSQDGFFVLRKRA